MSRLLSGRVKTRFDNLPSDNEDFLAPWGAEPYLGVPANNNTLLFLDADGTRRFDVAPVFLPGNEIQAQQTNVNADIFHVFVDAIGTNSQFLADPSIRFNPSTDTMFIDNDLEIGNDLSVTNNIDVQGLITTTSDERVKENINPITGATALGILKGINGYYYNRKDIEGNPLQLGVLAQEVRNYVPEAVQEDPEGKLSVAYNFLIPLLLEAIKELEDRIECLS